MGLRRSVKQVKRLLRGQGHLVTKTGVPEPVGPVHPGTLPMVRPRQGLTRPDAAGLLGSTLRRVLPTDISLPFTEPAQITEQARQAIREGFRTVKLRVGNHPQADDARLAAGRRAIDAEPDGEPVTFAADATGAWNRGEAIRRLRCWAPCRLAWIEQPVPASDLEGLAAVKRESPVPVIADESVLGPAELRRLVRSFRLKIPRFADLAPHKGRSTGIKPESQIPIEGLRISRCFRRRHKCRRRSHWGSVFVMGKLTRRRFVSSVLLSSAAAIAPRAWAAAPAKPGGTLICGWEAEPGAFDNDIDRGAVTRTLLHNIYDRLVDRDMTVPTSQPLVGNLATAWQVSPDARTYTFKLRRGVKFHDGTPFDAEAVKFNIDRDSDPSHKFYTKAGAGSLKLGYGNLASVDVLDQYTIRIVHKEPFADFLEVLAFGTYSIASPTAIQKYGNDDYPNHPVGTGPFKYVGREKGVKVTFERNPDYWAGAPALDGFIVRPLPEAVTRVTALQTGEVDWINAVNPDSMDAVKSNTNLTLALAQLPNTWGYIPNHKYPPTTKPALRQALNWAIDRETLARDVMKGLAIPARGTHAPGTPGYDPTIKGYGYNPAKAKRLLSTAGFPSGLPLEVWIPAGGAGSPFGIQMNEFIQQNFKDIGVAATFQQQEFQTFQNNMANGIQKDVNAIQVGFSVDEFVNLQRMFRTDLQPPNGNTNPGWYGSPQVDALLHRALGTTNDVQRRQLYFQVEQKAVDDAAWIFVVHQKAARAWNKKVRGYVNPASYMFTFRTVSMS